MTKLLCAGFIVAKLGWLPPEGYLLPVPRSAIQGYGKADLRKAARCLRMHGIRYILTGPKNVQP